MKKNELSLIAHGQQTGITGFEPVHAGIKIPCLTFWRYPFKFPLPRKHHSQKAMGIVCVIYFLSATQYNMWIFSAFKLQYYG